MTAQISFSGALHVAFRLYVIAMLSDVNEGN